MKHRRFEISTNTVFGLVIAVFALIGLFWIARSIFRILIWAAPVLLILTLIINYRVVTRYLEQVWNLLKNHTIIGVGAVVLTILGFPIVVAYLFFKAWMSRKYLTEEIGPKFTDYQEIEDDEMNSARKEKEVDNNE